MQRSPTGLAAAVAAAEVRSSAAPALALVHPVAPARAVVVPGRADVVAAHRRIWRHVAVTPVLLSPGLGGRIFLKDETVQATRSFKLRGALSALTVTPVGESVVTASAGNHGLGIARAAWLLGREATVVVPENASRTKVDALRAYPATIVQHGLGYDEAERHALALGNAGARFVSAYNDPDVIAGQGTIALEILCRVPAPCTIVAAIGGGGLVSGLALWASGVPGVRVVGVEGAGAPAMRAALDVGRITKIPLRPTLADGLGGNLEPGSVTYDLVQRYVDDVVVVSEEEIRAAIRFLALEHDLLAEGAGATAVAALLAGRVRDDGNPVVAVVSGGNIDAEVLAGVLAS